jgi:putative acetyltransferase
MPSQDGVTIRPTAERDVPALVDLMEAVAGEGRYIGLELPLDRDAQRRRFLDGIADEQTHSLVATRDDQVIGSLGLVATDHGHAELGMMLAHDARAKASARPSSPRTE